MKNQISMGIFLLLFWVTISFSQRANVILFMSDDVGVESFSSYGSDEVQTPNIDNFETEGVRFTQMYSQPLCTPSRVKIMTGRSNEKNYVRFAKLDPNEVTFGNLMQNAGYRTLVAGKWQLSDDNGALPEGVGFDEYCLWQLIRANMGSRYWGPTVSTLDHNGQKTENVVHPAGEFGPDIFNQYILDFITRNKDTSFFIYNPLVLPHNPFVTTPDDLNASGNKAKHIAMTQYMDKLIGKVVSHVDSLGIGDRTLIMYTSDNGTNRSITTAANGVDIDGDKGSPSDAGHHVPFVARWPGTIPGNQVNNEIFDFNIFLPTILDAGGVPIPDSLDLDGRSILSDLKGEATASRGYVYIFYEPLWGSWPKSILAMTDEYKLFKDSSFFNIQTDKLQENPISANNRTAREDSIYNFLVQVLNNQGILSVQEFKTLPQKIEFHSKTDVYEWIGLPGTRIRIVDSRGRLIKEAVLNGEGKYSLSKSLIAKGNFFSVTGGTEIPLPF